VTQSGQGEEPSARTAREGIVLPSDGGAPLHPSDLPPAPLPPSPPRPWDRREPWGSGEPAAPADPYSGAPSAPAAPEWGGQGSQSAYDAYGAYGAQAAYGTQGGTPLPPEGPQGQTYGSGGYDGVGSGAPLPPVAGEAAMPQAPMDEGATQYLPPVPAAGAMPMDEGATQYIPPVAAHPPAAEAATQFLPPVGPGALPPEASADATAYLGRVPDHGAGPMPPAGHSGQPPHAMPGGNPDAQPTQFIPPVAAQTPAPPQSYGAPGQQRAQQRRQPPQQQDVFDSLFRSDAAATGVSGATQQLPKIDPARAPQPPQRPGGHGGHTGRSSSERREGGGAGGGRTKSRAPLIALVGVGIAVLGIGAGALMAGSGDKESPSVNTPVAATGEPGESKAPADPAKAQAVALDKLLADSGNSRNSVIKAVGNIKTCTNLGQAATDLRDAAAQRNELVTRLGELSVDKLPGHEALTASLTKAWQASASADDHYAAWADQTAGKKGCRKGQARPTGQTQAGNAASGTASAEKTKAAKLWNTIATKYGLTQRQAVQL
jgi:hypothetical protein